MDFLNKTFKNRVTGDTFQIIDVYQNIAITDKKEKINTSILSNEKLFSPISSTTKTMNENRNFKEESVDPNNFFNSQNTYNAFAEKIKNIPLDKLPDDDRSNNYDNTPVTTPYRDLGLSTNESAIIMSDPEDEVEELKRKYGATTVDDSIRKQNDAFSKILSDELPVVQVSAPQQTQYQERQVEQYVQESEPPIQRIEVQDPLTSMFRNVKRNVDFNIDLKIEGKIPRLDFIEMMEDSYEVSIIDFLAQEFTENILRDPKLVKNKIKNEIKRLLEANSKNVLPQTKEVSTSSETTKTEIENKVEKRTRVRKPTKKQEKITTQND
jgi:hypothetical protein